MMKFDANEEDKKIRAWCRNENIDPDSLQGIAAGRGWIQGQLSFMDMINPAFKFLKYEAENLKASLALERESNNPLLLQVEKLKSENEQLRKAAEEVLRFFDSSSRYSVGFEIACEKLRKALEGRS